MCRLEYAFVPEPAKAQGTCPGRRWLRSAPRSLRYLPRAAPHSLRLRSLPCWWKPALMASLAALSQRCRRFFRTIFPLDQPALKVLAAT